MKYLSFDIEATGLEEHDKIIEFAMVPFDTEMGINHELEFHTFVHCPSFEELKPQLNQWVIDNNKGLIEKAHTQGIKIPEFKEKLEQYFESEAVKNYFGNEKIVLFGKSINAIDLPFLNRDLGWDWMRKYFHHRVNDLSSSTLALIDLGFLPKGSDSGSQMMAYLGMGEVAHTALEDAVNTAIIYLKILDKLKTN